MNRINKLNHLSLLLLTLLSVNLSLSAEAVEKPTGENPKPASASVYNLGLKSFEQGDIPSAISFFKRAIDLDPTFIDAYYNLGAIYKKQKNYHESAKAFQKAVDLNPKDQEATFELANSYLNLKDNENAKKYFSMIPSSFPKYGEVAKNLALIEQGITGQPQVTNNTAKNGQTDLDTNQAQLLANALAGENQQIKEASSQNVVEPQKVEPQKKDNGLINSLTKKDNLINPIRTVTDSFSGPTGIAKDSKNNIYVANFTKDSIERINVDGSKEIFIDKVGLLGPVGLAIDDADNLYVANYSGNSIVRIGQDRQVTVVVDKVTRPYYLFFDKATAKLFATVQGNDALVEIDTKNITKLPITFR